MEIFSQKKQFSKTTEDGGKESWNVILQMATKAIRFSLSEEECRERRTISWLNSPPKKALVVEKQLPTYNGFREILEADIIMAGQELLHYKSFFLDMQGVIFAHDEFQKMGSKKRASYPEHQRLTADGIDIITKSAGSPIYHINCHVYNFSASLAKYQFIPMTNVLLKQLNAPSGAKQPQAPIFFPFLALNRDYIDSFSVLFRGSRIRL